MENREKRKMKKGWIVLIVVLAVILTAAITGLLLVKNYLGRIARVETEPVEIIAPENEFFDVDEPVPQQPQSPEIPEAPDVPEPPENPETPEKPQSPETPQIPETPETPEVPETPDAPETPEAPEAPAAPQPPVIQVDPDAVQWETGETIEDSDLINLLLVGQDKPVETVTKQRQRADTVILCSINPKTGEVSLISFLRDLYVQIPNGYSDNRLNATYVFGGFKLLNETLALNFGVSVDHNLEVDMAGFQTIIDLVGGVDIDLSAAEARALNKNNNLPVTEGVNHMNGETALAFARLRSIDSDFGRTNRQREVLLAIFGKIRNLSAGELLNLVNGVLPCLTTDMTDAEILALAYRLLPLLSNMKISTYSVPANGTYSHAYIRGMAVLLPNSAKIRSLLEQSYLPLN